MKAVTTVWANAFYKRNALFFFLALCLLAFVFRPPTLLVSPYFVLPMFEDMLFFSIVVGLWTLYLIKCSWESFKTIHLPENRFLYLLASLPKGRLYRQIILQLIRIAGPALFYLVVIIAYSIYAGSWHWVGLLLWVSTWLAGTTYWMHYEIHHPREIQLSPGWQKWLEKRVSNSLAYISLVSLWHNYRRQVLIFKGIVILLLGLALWGQPMIPKALLLIFWSIACLQSVLAHRIRQSEDDDIFMLRNLPIGRPRRWTNYLVASAVLFIPESILWAAFSPGYEGLIQAFGYFCGAVAANMIGISLLYYQPYPLPDFINKVFVLYMTGFVILLFGLPLWGLAILCLLFSSWVFGEEFYKWNGWLEE